MLAKTNASAQNAANWTIEIRGTVEENNKKLGGATVTLTANGATVNSVVTPNGSFGFTLQGDMDYVLSFTKPGYITKRLSFSTRNVPADRAKFGFSAYSDIEVNIFPEIPGTNVDQILMQPIGKIGYDPKFHNGDFTFDQKYTESIQSLLDKILAAQKAAEEKAKQLEEQYKAAITKADAAFKANDYTNAKAGYNNALTIKPDEQYPKAQLAAIDKAISDKAASDAAAANKLAQQKASQAKYDSLIKLGDAAFKSQSYKDAKAAYTGAIQVKGDQDYPKNQIALIDKALADAGKKAAIQAKYDSLVKIGDKAFAAKQYSSAKGAYNGALDVKPAEQYPKDQLAAIDKAAAADADAAKKAAIQAKYDSLVKIGDNAFKAKSYDNAKSAYNGALQVKPAEQYPKDQLAAIDKAIADAATAADAAKKAAAEKALQAKYDSLVKIGDANFKSKTYDAAKAAYNGALQVKPAEQYPKDQLAAIDKAIAAEADAATKAAQQKALQAKYDSLVKIGDANFKTKTYDAAKAAYNGALQVKSAEQYPKDQLAAIDKAMAAEADAANKAAAEKALQAKYDSLVKIGDANFASKTYAVAKTAYNGALQVKPSEKYPKDQLALIDKAMAADADAAKKAAAEKALQAKYDSLVKIGDDNFKTKAYTAAKAAYNGALQVKPSEQYPKDQLAAIDKAIADAAAASDAANKAAAQKAIQAKYDSLIKIGDDNFKTKTYAAAKAAYNGALQVKSSEQYPKDQLALIDKAIADAAGAAQKAAMQAKYDSLVKIGDAAFKTKSYNDAKTAYNGALQIKSSEQYPKDQLALIDKAIADAAGAAQKAAMQAKYDSLVKIGDAAFKAKKYDDAKTAYNGALQVKSSEQYPKDQLALIDKAIADAAGAAQKAAMQAKYDSLVKIGDAAFKTKKYDDAKTAYNGALQVKSSEQYPKDQLALIDKALAGEADAAKKAAAAKYLQNEYDSLVKVGDAAFKTKTYDNAKGAYTAALKVKPEQQYPKDQLALIDKALSADADAAKKAAAAKYLQNEYDSLVKVGDAAFKTKTYDDAKGAYTAALKVKPEQQYPKDQLALIDKALADVAAQADAAKKAAAQKAIKTKYDSLVKIGDNAFKAKTYDKAKTAYNGALQVMPDQQYPKDQLALIDKAAAQAAAGDADYNNAITAGNQLYFTKKYKEALAQFQKASLLKPNESLPKQRIAQIQQQILRDQSMSGNNGNNNVKPPIDSTVTANASTPDSVAAKYGQGVTEETVDEPNCQITRRIVVKGKHGYVFTRKTWNFGTYYFKAAPPDFGDVAITESDWTQETSK